MIQALGLVLENAQGTLNCARSAFFFLLQEEVSDCFRVKHAKRFVYKNPSNQPASLDSLEGEMHMKIDCRLGGAHS